MLIHVICELGKAKAEFDLPCGDGQKSIKCVVRAAHLARVQPRPLSLPLSARRWLATVAAARLCQFTRNLRVEV